MDEMLALTIRMMIGILVVLFAIAITVATIACTLIRRPIPPLA